MNEDETRPPRLTIHIQSGVHVGKRYTFSKERVTLGRSSSNDIVLPSDSCVSAHHAQVVWNKDHWDIQDRDSKNGIYVEHEGNRQKLLDAARVVDDDLYLLGLTLIRMSTREDCGHPDEEPAHHAATAQQTNLILRVTASEEDVRFQLLSEDACAAEYTAPYRPDEIAALNEGIRMQVQRARLASGALAVEASRELARLGAALTESLLPPRLRDKLREAAGRPLFLILDPRLISVPWELAQLAGEALCLQFEMGRQVLVEDFTIRRTTPGRPPDGMLIAADPAGEFEPARAQAESLFHFLRGHAPDLDLTFLAGTRITRMGLLERLNRARCVYFNGHIEYDDAHPGNSAWVLKDGRLRCDEFRRLTSPPGFVFANGCESCREPEWNGTESSYGMASAFLLSGVRTYVGTLWPIPAEPSGAFAQTCFAQLIQGATIGKALREARLVLRAHENGASATWASYVLYGNPAHTPL